MKCLKVEEYIKRTASMKETELLLQELENYVRNGLGIQGRTLCDRVIRACNHQLGVGSPDSDHVSHLVKLVELSLHGYDSSAALVHQTIPLYMEKIIFHIVKKLSSLEAHSLCTHVAEMLYNRLKPAQQAEDYCILLRSCFSLLWSGVSAAKDRKILNPRDKLHCQMQALSFLLLLKTETAFFSKAPLYTEKALTEYESSCGMETKEDSSFLLQEMLTVFNRFWTVGRGCEDDGGKQSVEISTLYVLSEMVLMGVKVLCVAGQYDLASTSLNEFESKVKDCGEFQCTALLLGKWAVKLTATMKSGEENAQLFTQCARVLRSIPVDLGDQEAHAVLEGCGLVEWVISRHKKGLSGAVLLACFAFLEEHQKQIINMLKRISSCEAESSRLQQALCFSMYQGFVLAYESLLSSQLDNSETLERVLLYCQATTGQMMNELHKLPSENLLIKAVIAVTNLACGLYNQRLYDQAFILIEILCKDLLKNCPTSLSVDRLSRAFMLAVQSSRRAGQLERALDWVILWLKALKDNIKTDMSEPVSLWVKIKIDAARNSEEDIRLRTLRDGFGPDVPDEGVLLSLLDEELRAYKEVAGDTAQERYNTLCDLLEICHEESPHTHLRVVYLCEMAQVVCFQDFSEQTDCTAVDFTLEALRLLEEIPETPENSDRLHDNKAHSFLWLYICTLEKNLQEAIEKDNKCREVCEQTPTVANPIGTNDFDYEEKQKTQDSIQVYEGLHFNLAAENKMCKPLERALDEWSTLLKSEILPSVRNPRQTCNSIGLTAALFRLMGKPVKALEAYQLAIRLSHHLADTHGRANFLCQSASILLDVGSPELALMQLEQAEKLIHSDTTAEGPSPVSMLAILLKSQYCYSTGQVESGVSHLCSVLKEVNEQKQSKSWYLLRARTLHTCCSYLSLDTAALPQMQRSCITQFGINSPDTAIYESLKLICSLLVTLVGKGLYGSNGCSSDVRFIDQGDNLVLKWQLLSELLNCSVKMVTIRRHCGVINDARLQCLEALKLAIKLQTLSQCAELLVIKAELELMQGEKEECGLDLKKVQDLLDLCTDHSDQVKRAEVKIKPRKGRPAQKSQSPLPALEEDFKDILSTRWINKEVVVKDVASSPPLKAQPHRWLSSLAHETDCQCPCCSEPCLGRATARWAAAMADLVLQLNPNESKVSLKLQCAALTRCKSLTAKLGAKLQKLSLSCSLAKGSCKPSLMQDVMGRVYLHMSMSGLEPRLHNISDIWKIMEAGLTFVDSTPSPLLRPIRAGIKATKAMVSLMSLASKKGCVPEELFSNVWAWNAPNDQELKLEERTTSLKKTKKSIKNPEICDKTKAKVVKPKIQLEGICTKGKGLFPMTPVRVKSKFTVQELGCFDFNTVVPTLPFTPVQKVKTSARKAPRTVSKQPFHVYEELSPKAPQVPAAPRRTRKLRFKVDFSDESDSEAKTKPEPKDKTDVPKKRTTAKRAASSDKKAPDLLAEKVPMKRQSRVKKRNDVSQGASSEDDGITMCQPASTRRGRTRGRLTTAEAESAEEPDKMRCIEEDTNEVMEISIEELRTSDAETEDKPASSFDFEVLRRDVCCNFEWDDLPEVRNKSRLRERQQTHLPPSNNKPEYLSLEDAQSLLRSAWLSLQHFPSPTIYPSICSLLALTIGQQDPVTTAMLHSQSLGITSRHRTIRHLASCVRKLRKTHSDLAEKMDAVSLNEASSSESKTSAEQRLSQLEKIFSFPTSDSSSFPSNHCQDFIEQLEHLPSGITVCVMSLVGLKPGEMGNSILLSRFEKGSAPVTVHIPTSKRQLPISCLVQEMDNIQVEQKVISCVSEKAMWWEGRRALDSRVEQLLKEMEGLLGCWKSFLLPLSSDPDIFKETQHLCEALSGKGMTVSKEMLQAVLSASPVLSEEDLHRFARGLSRQSDVDCEQLLCKAASQLEDRTEPLGHVVLILDKYLQKLPWESISILKSCSVSRMPSLQSLIGLNVQLDSKSILKQGVDAKQVFYVLDPDANLGNSQDQFKEWFSSKLAWEGVCGVAPDSTRLEEAVATKDLYIYVGHGAGSRFLDGQAVLKRQMRAASMLFGCSSAALAVRGDQEGHGIILNYLIAGCPLVLGNLWDVTDRDIDRFTKALLESWLGAGSGAPLLDHMGSSRQATHLKHLIGAAPVVYGLPVHLQ